MPAWWWSSNRDQQKVRTLVSMGSMQEAGIFQHPTAAQAWHRAKLDSEKRLRHTKGSPWAVGAEMEQQQ